MGRDKHSPYKRVGFFYMGMVAGRHQIIVASGTLATAGGSFVGEKTPTKAGFRQNFKRIMEHQQWQK